MLITCLLLFINTTLCAKSIEPVIDYQLLSQIELNMNQTEVVKVLGEPLLILADTEFDNGTYLFYNYSIKQYNTKKGEIVAQSRNRQYERKTLLKFTFIDEELTSWQEDKTTLAMSNTASRSGRNTLLQYFSLILNLILIIKIM